MPVETQMEKLPLRNHAFTRFTEAHAKAKKVELVLALFLG